MTKGPIHAAKPGRKDNGGPAFGSGSCCAELPTDKGAWGVGTIVRDVLVGMFDARLQRSRQNAVEAFLQSDKGEQMLKNCARSYAVSMGKEVRHSLDVKDVLIFSDHQKFKPNLNLSDAGVKNAGDIVESLLNHECIPSQSSKELDMADWKAIMRQVVATQEVIAVISAVERHAKRQHVNFSNYIKELFEEALENQYRNDDVGSMDPRRHLSVTRVLKNLVQSSDANTWQPTEFLADEFTFFLNEDAPDCERREVKTPVGELLPGLPRCITPRAPAE